MTSWLKGLGALIEKELRLEVRGKETVTLLFCNAVIAAALVGVGTSSAFLDALNRSKIFPMLLWALFLLSATASVVRAYEQELENRGFEGLLLAGATGPQMYIAKFIVTSLLYLCHFIILSIVLGVALDQSLTGKLAVLVAVGCGASTALAAVTVLLSGIAGTSRLRGVILPVIALPLLFPVFFAGVELTAQLVVSGGIEPTTVWPTILVCANAVYVVLGINLYEAAIRE